MSRTRTREREDEDEDERVESVERVVEPPLADSTEINNLPVQVSFVVPSTRGGDVLPKEHFEDRVKYAKKWFDERFGGDTTVRGKGGYLMDDELIEEPVAIVESSMSVSTYEEYREEFGEFIKERRENWDQDTVMFTVEDRVFIYPKRDYIDDGETVPPGFVLVN